MITSNKTVVLSAAAMGYIVLVAQVLLQIFVISAVVENMGKSAVGTYSFLLQLAGVVALLEFGFAVSISHRLTTAFGNKNKGDVVETIFAGKIGFLFVSLIYSLSYLVLYLIIDKIPISLEFDVVILKKSLLILLVCNFLKTFFTINGQALTGNNQQWKFHLGSLIGIFIRAIIIAIAIYKNWGVLGLVLSFGLSEVCSFIVHYLLDSNRKPVFQFSFSNRVLSRLKSVTLFGFSLTPMQVASRISYSSDSIIAGLLFSPELIAKYYTTQMPPFLLLQSLFILFDSFLPHLIQSYSANNKIQLRKAFHFLIRLSCFLTPNILFGTIIFSEPIVRGWVGAELYVGSQVTTLIAVFCATEIFMRPFFVYLYVKGDVKLWSAISFSASIAKLFLSYFFGKYFGLVGLMAGSVLTSGVSLIILFKLFSQINTEGMKMIAFDLFIKPIKYFILLFILFLFEYYILSTDSLEKTSAILCGYCLVSVSGAYFIIADIEDRQTIKAYTFKILRVFHP